MEKSYKGHAGLAVGGAVVLATLVACTATQAPTPVGRALYLDYCSTCHGPEGKGDGPLAGDWEMPPADLTGIARRNGGKFPLAQVMTKIDGYGRSRTHGATMPEMGQVFQDADQVMVDTGDGIETPVPVPLFELAEYLRSIQDPAG